MFLPSLEIEGRKVKGRGRRWKGTGILMSSYSVHLYALCVLDCSLGGQCFRRAAVI